jgi:hypothetical protein
MRVGRRRPLLHLRREGEARRALTLDHPGVGIGVDQRAAGLRQNLGGGFVAVLAAGAVIGDDGAPMAAVASSFTFGASLGMTMIAGMPRRRAAQATPCAWLPLETPTTPLAASSG